MGCNLLHDLIQVRLGQAVGEPLHGCCDHGILRLSTPLQAAESGRGGLVGHGVLWLGWKLKILHEKFGESMNNIYF